MVKSKTHWDPCLKIRAWDLKVLTKFEPEALCKENWARDFTLQKSEPVSKPVRSETWATQYSKKNKYNQVISVARNRITFTVACSVNLSLYVFVPIAVGQSQLGANLFWHTTNDTIFKVLCLVTFVYCVTATIRNFRSKTSIYKCDLH